MYGGFIIILIIALIATYNRLHLEYEEIQGLKKAKIMHLEGQQSV
jgi:hypothetical protein